MSKSSCRAKSARDLFISDHPEIRQEATLAAHANGITNTKDITGRINKAYTEAIRMADDFNKYQRLSEEDKLRKAAERKDQEEAAGGAEPVSGLSSHNGTDRSKYVLFSVVAIYLLVMLSS